jgi:hypothetical protein
MTRVHSLEVILGEDCCDQDMHWMRTNTQGFSCILLEAIPGRGIGDSFSALGFVKY